MRKSRMGRPARLPRLDGEELFSWSAGFSSDYNGWAQDVSIHPQAAHPRYVWSSGTIEGHRNSDPPIITGDGFLLASVNLASKGDHCEWKVRHPRLIEKTYLHIGRTYVWEIENRINTTDRLWQWPNTHVTWWQVWTKDRKPCALQVYKSQWRLQNYGDTVDNSHYWGVPDSDWHNWLIVYTPDPFNGRLTVWQDGNEVFNCDGPTCYTGPTGGQQRVGCYTVPTRETMSISYRRIRMSEV